MTSTSPIPGDNVADLNAAWPDSHAWAIDQMPCPAYCCSMTGAIVHCNAAAVRIWGWRPDPGKEALWDGFAALRDLDGQFVDRDACPCASAASGNVPVPTELFADSNDGQLRRIIVHAKPVLDADRTTVGVVCCLTDISEKRHLQARARDAADAREDFLSMLAHELRNPLAPIMSAACYLQRANVDPAVARMAGVVERQTKQLARFIADLLDASRVARVCQLPVEPRTCTEDEVLAMALDVVAPAMQARKQRLIIDSAANGGALCCDPERVAQALSNVLANASAFTPDGEAFSLRVFVHGKVLLLEVVDCGAGIAQTDLAHVFEPFERRAVAPGRSPVGAGLGLTIAKGVCEAHGGSIDVRSAGLGQGTTVWLTLPVVENTT